jgi:hypothetical protein
MPICHICIFFHYAFIIDTASEPLKLTLPASAIRRHYAAPAIFAIFAAADYFRY